MSSPEEIWSTRLQREILALTEEGEDQNHIGILPPFIALKSHHLDINEGICTLDFVITVEGVERAPPEPKVVDKDIISTVDSALGETEEEEETTETANEAAEAEKETEEPKIENATEMDVTEHHSNESPESAKFKVQVGITLVASLQKRNAIFSASSSYPFFKPRAILASGAEHFTSMKIKNGDEVQIDCDWTPSLHLNDAAMNISLKVRESIKRGEPCLKVVKRDFHFEGDLLDEVKADFSKAGAKVSSFFSDLKSRASAVADELDNVVGSSSTAAAVPSDASSNEANQEEPRIPKKMILKLPKNEKAGKAPPKVVTAQNIEIGDEIDLADDPWNKAVGLYPCKALRRPSFIVAAMEAAGQNKPEKVREHEERECEDDAVVSIGAYGHEQCTADNYLMLHSGGMREVANAGFSGAGSMFRSFTKSAKSLVEESFVMLTEDLIVEIKCNKFAVASATVSFAIPVSHLAKLKFRREESVSLFFKQAPDDPIIYMCSNSADAVKQIQNVLKRHGVKGKHTNATMQKTVQSAIQTIEDIKAMEQQLQDSPSPEKVTVIMDLYRQAADKFVLAGDVRHEEVMSQMRGFLASPLVVTILEESDKEKQEQAQKMPVAVAQEPVLTTDKVDAEAVSTDSPGASGNDNNDTRDDGMEKAMEEAENMLKSAHDDLAELSIDDFDDDDDDDDNAVPSATNADVSAVASDDVISEFEDMLKDADKELQELMGS